MVLVGVEKNAVVRPKTAPVAKANLRAAAPTLLIKIGDGDDGWFYQAPILAQENGGTLTIGLHDGSWALERLRLHGELTATAQLNDGSTFCVRLSNRYAQAINGLALVQVMFGDPMIDCLSAPRLMPQT